jgi:hypothetical protein
MSIRRRSKVTAEQTMPGSRTESSRSKNRPQRKEAIESIREVSHTTIVQQSGNQSHNHDDLYARKNGNDDLKLGVLTVNGRALFNGSSIFQSVGINRDCVVSGALNVFGPKNSVVNGLYFAATESDRARFWTMVEISSDAVEPADVLAALPEEFSSVTQAPYWISREPGFDIEGNVIGWYARVTADVRDDLGPQQKPYGKGR